MMKKKLMMVLLLGVISVSGCHTAHRTSVRAVYNDPYPYSVSYVDPRYYGGGPYFYPAYYDPYPYFFFRSDFLFFEPSRRIFIFDDDRFSRPRRSLRGSGRSGGGRSFGGSSRPAPAPSSPAPGPAPQRRLR